MYRVNLIRFLTRQTSTLHFLSVGLIICIVYVVFGDPTDVLRYTSQTSGLNQMFQMSINVLVGYTIVALSREAMILYRKKWTITPAGCILWLFSELIICVAVVTLVLWSLSGGGKLQLAAAAGDVAFKIIILEIIPYLISFLLYCLHEEHAEVIRLRALLPQHVVSENISLDPNINFTGSGGKIVFSTNRTNVLFIEAANNYAIINYTNDDKEDTFVIHNTMKELEKTLAIYGFVRCHRGYIVNVEKIISLRKEGTNMILDLIGSDKTIPVTKTYVDGIYKSMAENAKLTLNPNFE